MPAPPPQAPRFHALIPCAGSGSRSGAARPKQYVEVAGASLIAHTLSALAAVPRLDTLWVVLSPDDAGFEAAVSPAMRSSDRLHTLRCGADTRAGTVLQGLAALREAGVAADDWVLVHDAARCLLRPEWVERLLDACAGDPVGGLLALPLADTLKEAAGDCSPGQARVARTLDRSGKWLAQTPQMFRLGALQSALAAAGPAVTDEASAMEAAGHAPLLVPAPLENFKLTWPADFELAESVLAGRALQKGTR